MTPVQRYRFKMKKLRAAGDPYALELYDRRKCANKKWISANRKKFNGYMRKSHLQRRYGLSIEQFDALLRKQKGKCAICREPFKARGKYGPCVDHDHRTQKVRGLLCTQCNRALGFLKDSAAVVRRALKYLEK